MHSRTKAKLGWLSVGIALVALGGLIEDLADPTDPDTAVACQVALETAPDTLGILILDPPDDCLPYFQAKLRASGFSVSVVVDSTPHPLPKE